jgi:hypothetical protein
MAMARRVVDAPIKKRISPSSSLDVSGEASLCPMVVTNALNSRRIVANHGVLRKGRREATDASLLKQAFLDSR